MVKKMGYYSALKKKETLPFVTAWISLKDLKELNKSATGIV